MEQQTAELLRASVDRALFIEDCFRQRSPFCDREIIAEHLPVIRSDTERLDDEIAQLKTTLSLLERHRDRLNDSIEKGRWLAFPPPVRKLPSELVANIFTFALSFDDGYNRLFSIPKEHDLPLPIPMSLSAVCSSWRETALSTPHLWSAISLELDENTEADQEVEHLRLITELFIARSHTSPLTLRVCSLTDVPAIETGDPFAMAIDHALETLCQRSAQWFSIDLIQALPLYFLPAFQSVTGNLPNLRTLSATAEALQDLSFIFAGSCPALRSIELLWWTTLGPGDSLYPGLDAVPWRQVEDLILCKHDMSLRPSLIELVSWCPSLTSLNYSHNPDSTAHAANHMHISAGHIKSNIETLSLTLFPNYTDSLWATFANQITLPRLSSLTLHKYSWREVKTGDISPILRCISRSSCLITTLTIGYNTLERAQLYRDLFSLTPGLTSLIARNDDGPSVHGTLLRHNPARDLRDLLNLLLVDHNPVNGETSPDLLPRLRNIALDLDGTDEDLEAIYELVKSRWIPDQEMSPQVVVDCLRSVTITLPSLPERSPLEELRKLGEEGLEVFINAGR
ncbi:hypothetical protein PQX77_002329 [Marasmius sp. AFHP31]|nr:hypothetical protein PQX77_002329 [Marasmius sp. AFHP31]